MYEVKKGFDESDEIICENFLFMKKCLVIDDDPLICDLLKHFCSKMSWIETCWSVEDGNQALQALTSQQFDFIFLDYNLPDLNASTLLPLIPSTIPVIMVTTEEGFGAASYEFPQIIDFLVKPITYERFLKATVKLQLKEKTPTQVNSDATANPKKIMVKDGTTTVIVIVDDIQYIKSESNYVVFYLKDKKVMSLMSLKQLERDLPTHFLRIHKSFMINLNALETISADEVSIGDTAIPIGAKHKAELIAKLEEIGQ